MSAVRQPVMSPASGGRVEQVLEDARIATAGGSTSAGRPHERALFHEREAQ